LDVEGVDALLNLASGTDALLAIVTGEDSSRA